MYHTCRNANYFSLGAAPFSSGHMVPYNVPSSALDMLKRFLVAESFIDEELPQVRYVDKALSQKKYKGAEKWMNTPAYPKLPKERRAGGTSYYSLVGIPSFESKLLLGSSENLGSQNSTYTGMAFLAGVVASFVVMKLVNRFSMQRGQGYETVPDAS